MVEDVIQLMVIHGPFDATRALYVDCIEWVKHRTSYSTFDLSVLSFDLPWIEVQIHE